MKPIIDRLLSRYIEDPITGCWNWTRAKTASGYGQLSDWNYETKTQKVLYTHRLSYEYHSGLKIPKGMDVMHSCDNPACMNPKHLSVGTRLDNVKDCRVKRRHSRGLKHSMKIAKRKLSTDDVWKIRALCQTLKQTVIARMYNVNSSTICSIHIGRSWKHLT
jgi:hypothetical protein